MTFRGSLVCLVLLLAGCAPPLGRVLVTVVFENETRTQCIKASARNASGSSVNATPPTLARAGKDTLRIGLGETADLVGEVRVTIARFSTSDCTGTAFSSETRNTDVVRGAATAMVEFRYTDGAPDGGMDGGSAGSDGGIDAGCDVMACANSPGECELAPATGCGTDGGCRFGFRAIRTPCTGGVCNSAGSCVSDVCSLLPDGDPCDAGLSCAPTGTCSGGICAGNCAFPPICNAPVMPAVCDSVTPTSCVLRAANDYGGCPGPNGSQCLDGGCMPWLPFTPTPMIVPIAMRDLPYPTDAWNLSSSDGGFCDTVVSTTGSASTVLQGDCGFPALGGRAITAAVNDAGVAVITTRGLDLGPGARLHFVGGRPVQLIVIGDASIRGVLSVAPILGGQLPAGTGPSVCSDAGAGISDKAGGGGGGFGGIGGDGAETGFGRGGNSTSMVFPLRGGCPGGNGFRRNSGMSLGGVGGGALQLLVANSFSIDGGAVTASGAGGTQGVDDNEGGGGGGSGGLIIIEANSINLHNGAVTANGGGGGEGGSTGSPGLPGLPGPIYSATGAPAANGGNGGFGGSGGDDATPRGGNAGTSGGANGGGGGGGAVGVVFIRANLPGACTKAGNGIISGSQPMSISCP